jgi:hypothetical protein
VLRGAAAAAAPPARASGRAATAAAPRGRHFAELLARGLLGGDASSPLERSPALLSRSRLDLRGEETVARLLDRGTLDDWRELYRLARRDAELRARLGPIVSSVPLG